MHKQLGVVFLVGFCLSLQAQINNYETSSFKFLNIPSSSRHNYLGKAAIATFDPDIDIALANPSLIQFNTKDKVLVSSALYFESLYGNVAYSLNNHKFDIPIVVGANFISYGEQIRTDVGGTQVGKFNPNELAGYVAASKTYLHYTFGAQVKVAYSNFIAAQMAGVTVDASMLYRDVERDIYATLLLKNMGFQIMQLGTERASTPFDIQIGFSKKLKHMPFRFSVMAGDLYGWNTLNNSADYYQFPIDPFITRTDNDIATVLLSKLVFAGEVSFGRAVKVGLSYDVRRSIEGRFNAFRGMNGLAMGFGIYTRKYDVGYSFSKITPVSVSHQFTIGLHLKEWL